MAVLESTTPKTAGKRNHARPHSFCLNMTPMVDLAFLLLTFFILTTTFARPRVQELQMPVPDAKHPSEVKQSEAMTILLGQGRTVAYYFGLNDLRDPTPLLHRTDFSARDLRQALLARQRQGLVTVFIKAEKSARYQSLVDVLDEMNITDQKRYTLTTPSVADCQLLAATARS